MKSHWLRTPKTFLLVAVVAVTMHFSPCSQAAFITGSVLVPPSASVIPTVTGAPPGTLLASLEDPFSFTTTAGTTSGDIVSAVYRNTTGTLDFYYQVVNSPNSVTSLSRESSTSFAGFLTAVAFRMDGASLGGGFVNGSILPVTADRDPSGTVVGFNFVPAPGTRILPGTTSVVLVISTDATNFREGNAEVIDGGTVTVPSFEPAAAVPDAGTTALLLGLGLAGLSLARYLGFSINPKRA